MTRPKYYKKTLRKYGFPAVTIDLIEEIYRDSTANLYTLLRKAEEELKMRSGVKQGCGLSPFLSVIYINPILEKIKKLKRDTEKAKT
jgi:hypothetical protein